MCEEKSQTVRWLPYCFLVSELIREYGFTLFLHEGFLCTQHQYAGTAEERSSGLIFALTPSR